MRFNQEIEEELFRMAKYSRISVSYYYGYIIEFDKANVDGITPLTLIFTIKKYIRNYFKNNSNIKVKTNNK